MEGWQKQNQIDTVGDNRPYSSAICNDSMVDFHAIFQMTFKHFDIYSNEKMNTFRIVCVCKLFIFHLQLNCRHTFLLLNVGLYSKMILFFDLAQNTQLSI